MEAVEVGDGDGLSVVVRVQDRDEAHGDGRDGQDVEQGVEELLVDLSAASVGAVGQQS